MYGAKVDPCTRVRVLFSMKLDQGRSVDMLVDREDYDRIRSRGINENGHHGTVLRNNEERLQDYECMCNFSFDCKIHRREP